MKLITALHPAAIMALSIGGPSFSLEAREREGPSISQTFESLAGLGLVNGTGCVIDDDGSSKVARAELEGSCTNQQQQVDTALAQCIKRAKSAEKAAKDGSALFEQYFMTQDSDTRDKVAQFFAEIATGCDKNGNQPVSVRCTPDKRCTLPQTGNMELAAIATNLPGGGSSIQLCRSAFTMYGDRGGNQRRQDQGQCQQNLSKLGDLFVHEMSHAATWTRDVIYGKDGCLGLTTDQALQNADSYALFAQDVSAGCAAEAGVGKQPPNNGNNPPVNGNNPPVNGNNPPVNDNNPPIDDNNPPVNDNNPPVNDNNPPVNDNNPPVNDNNPPVNDNNPPVNDNNPPVNGNNPPVSCGNEMPPNDGNERPPNDQIDSVANDQIDSVANDQDECDANDQASDDINNQIGSDANGQFGNDDDYLNNQGGGDGIDQYGNDEDYLNNQGCGDGSFGGDEEYLSN